ncbi:uncharacterized protein F4822DRAFT_104158 [Hypoxylon trugodes]|uniref:uncharacterized protein n=1 Tax=Hypoxylon trugodes TaxID=326681 RepID=UPI0021986864|nr:uncharacterized protein F4822DRAFT_104158 [Hypoxylon trugodes]KAI1382591.1 hypothetical protein F4822DRAFT_104158 [Hypoxylon trugodes]
MFKAEEQRIVAKVQLESTAKIFVRNNKDYLYFGTHSEEGADGFRMNDSFWFPQKIHLTALVGYDIGSTVCFEIIDDYFYGLSNQTDFEIRETNWTSYYHCFRFPLDDPDPKMTQTMEKTYSWRRQHAEGPIDDRWGFLKSERDQTSGRLHIIESRKEWLNGQSGSRRSYYITKVVFDPELEVSEEENSDTEPSITDGSTSDSTNITVCLQFPLINSRKINYISLLLLIPRSSLEVSDSILFCPQLRIKLKKTTDKNTILSPAI